MEATCHRCHGTVQPDDCYCPACGLPQLVYQAEDGAAPGQADRWNEAVRDANVVAWRPALRLALMLAVPAGVLCSALSPVNILGLVWMAAAAAWAVVLYVRSQQAPWITLGAGARIGLVTGIFGGWTAGAVTGMTLVVKRFLLHQGHEYDALWEETVKGPMTRLWTAVGADAHTIAVQQAWQLSPEGRAGAALEAVVFLACVLMFFAIAGGALGARITARSRRPEI